MGIASYNADQDAFRAPELFRECLTSKMSHAYGRRGSCAAGGVTVIGVGSSAWLGTFSFGRIVGDEPSDLSERHMLSFR